MGRVGAPGGVPLGPHQEVPVAHPGVKAAPVPSQGGFQDRDELSGFIAGDVPGGVVLHDELGVLVAQGHQVAAEGHLVGSQVHPQGRGLQGRPAGVVAYRVVPHDGQIGDVAARLLARGDGAGAPQLAPAGQFIHMGGFCRLQRGFAAQLGDGIVPHAVADENDVFHR